VPLNKRCRTQFGSTSVIFCYQNSNTKSYTNRQVFLTQGMKAYKWRGGRAGLIPNSLRDGTE
jgi:hypothetical protein